MAVQTLMWGLVSGASKLQEGPGHQAWQWVVPCPDTRAFGASLLCACWGWWPDAAVAGALRLRFLGAHHPSAGKMLCLRCSQDGGVGAHGRCECREDLGTEYARKLEELHREEQLINKEELEAEGLLQGDAPSVAANEARRNPKAFTLHPDP